MKTNVRSYTDKELLERVKSLPSFKGIPENFWLLGVRSTEDAFNRFDDKMYLFKGEKFIKVWKVTTNAGKDLLDPTHPRGEAVLKSDEIYYDSHERRKHKNKVLAYCQRIDLPLFRDNNRNHNIEELGEPKMENTGINIHPASYQIGSKVEKEFINGWSVGCQVFAIRADFDEMMRLTRKQPTITYSLLKEF
jgi:hypothetical protein